MREVSVPAPCGQSKSQHRTIEISHEQTHKTDSIRQMKLKSLIRPQKYKYVIPGVKKLSQFNARTRYRTFSQRSVRIIVINES